MEWRLAGPMRRYLMLGAAMPSPHVNFSPSELGVALQSPSRVGPTWVAAPLSRLSRRRVSDLLRRQLLNLAGSCCRC